MTGLGESPAPPTPIRWTYVAAVVLAAVLSLWAIALFIAVAIGAGARGELGYDARLYVQFAERFLDTGVLYSPEQLTGPYPGAGFVNLYPPLALYLFIPFTVLPLALWWAIPVGVLAWHVRRCRPDTRSWPILALIAGLPATAAMLAYGNATLWSMAIVALACRWPVVAPALLFKPADVFGAIVVTRRLDETIPGLLVVLVLSVLLAPYWIQWVESLMNLEDGLARNVLSIPVVLWPAIVWWARRRDPAVPASG